MPFLAGATCCSWYTRRGEKKSPSGHQHRAWRLNLDTPERIRLQGVSSRAIRTGAADQAVYEETTSYQLRHSGSGRSKSSVRAWKVWYLSCARLILRSLGASGGRGRCTGECEGGDRQSVTAYPTRRLGWMVGDGHSSELCTEGYTYGRMCLDVSACELW